jgi:hypothetical protein
MYSEYNKNWTSFNRDLDCFVIVSPLLKHSGTAMFIIHKESRLSNRGKVGASNASMLIDIHLYEQSDKNAQQDIAKVR